jgi:putative oxidoreductase
MAFFKRLANPGVESPGGSIGLLLLRLGAAGMMIFGHGWPKVAAFGEKAASFADPLGDPLGVGPKVMFGALVFAELLCSALVAVGVFTRVAAVPLIVAMSVAGFVRHADDPFATKELALLYLGAFTTLLFTGAGRFSVDNRLAK